ncbi:integrase [Spongiactinospora rosea]|uniref:Integrase n=1 Tax=Spongiactinospora rosea TaxID=2248750 RepID=A0A366LX90_9ACTN|nr:integrase [Spongiactinospora rosea]RBQ18586.1 integrase [Spongiactinospora rosea]
MKGRLRKLRTPGREFAWTADIRHIPGSTDCHRGFRLRVWGGGKNGCLLQADLLSTSGPSPWGFCTTDVAHPLPRDVRALVTRALAAGWDPAAKGGTFVLTEREHAAGWELPGFLVTDRLRNPKAADPTRRVLHSLA